MTKLMHKDGVSIEVTEDADSRKIMAKAGWKEEKKVVKPKKVK